MKAAVLVGPHQVEIVGDWPEPRCGPGDVVVEMAGVGICGSDLSIHGGPASPPSLPWVMGHEGVGEITWLDAAVTDRYVGQRVVIEPNYCCFGCAACRAGRTSACPHRVVVGMNSPGLLRERVAVPSRFTWPVPAEADFTDLMCTEPAAVARTAVHRSGVSAGDACLVVGAGSQGLFVCQALLAAGAQPHVVEPHADRRKLAEWIGARVAHVDQGDFPYVFETSGAAPALQTAMDSAAGAGQIVLIGISPDTIPVTLGDLVRRQLQLRGSLIYDHPHDFRQAIAEITSRRLRPGTVVAARYPLDEAADAFAAARDVPGKACITFPPGLHHQAPPT